MVSLSESMTVAVNSCMVGRSSTGMVLHSCNTLVVLVSGDVEVVVVVVVEGFRLLICRTKASFLDN